MREVSERSEPVVDRDRDGALRRQCRSVVDAGGARPPRERASVDPDHDRPSLGGVGGAGPHVQVQAVLRRRGGGTSEEGARAVGGLHALRAEAVRAQGSLPPRFDRLRRPPAPVPHGRRRERNPPVGADAVDHDALDVPRGGLDAGVLRAQRRFEAAAGQRDEEEAGQRTACTGCCTGAEVTTHATLRSQEGGEGLAGGGISPFQRKRLSEMRPHLSNSTPSFASNWYWIISE